MPTLVTVWPGTVTVCVRPTTTTEIALLLPSAVSVTVHDAPSAIPLKVIERGPAVAFAGMTNGG